MNGSQAARFPYVAIDVAEDQADDATERLFELGAGGVEWRDATTLAQGVAGKVTLVASFEREDEARAAARDLPAGWSPRVDEIIGDAWRDEWKKHFEPFALAGPIVVAPPWRPYEAKADERVIVLEPGRAFGTGLHETTSLVAQVLVDHAERFRGGPVLDVGCGSGILSLVALVIGARSVRAVDVDPDAVLATHENAERNGLSGGIEVDGAPVSALTGPYATVVANIETRTLVELAPALVARVGAGGLLVLAGILAADAAPAQLDDVRRAYRGLNEEEVRRKGDWVALVLSR
jgi:ribosomal protein L11 methyltransferase